MRTVAELRDELVELGMSEGEAAGIVGKSNIRSKIEELKVTQESDDILSNVEFEDEEEGTAGEEGSDIDQDDPPLMSDPKWSDYVLSHLEENELIKGHPKADSLRRLTELLIGPVIDIRTEVPQCPTLDNERRATVVVHIEVLTGTTAQDNYTLKASGVADVFSGNTETLYAQFATATAETRAEGRAYRKMLRLINVVTAEELVDENEIYDPTDRITDEQIMMIDQQCSPAKLDIDVEKLFELHGVNVASLDRVNKSKALTICKVLKAYPEIGVPKDLVGYKQNWRE